MTRISLLIIDDEAPIRKSLANFLEDYEYDVTQVSSGEQALSAIQRKSFDVAIVDLRLPGINGEAFILRAGDIMPGLRYIIHTGSVDYRISSELMEMGVCAHQLFAKPIHDLQQFVTTIKLLLAKS